jgi:hypothetical protein
VQAGVVQVAQGVAGRTRAVDDDGTESVFHGCLEAPLATVVEFDEVRQGPQHALEASEALHPGAGPRFVKRSLQGLGTGLERVRAVEGFACARLALLFGRRGFSFGRRQLLVLASPPLVVGGAGAERRRQLRQALLVLEAGTIEAGESLGKTCDGLASRRETGEHAVVLLARPAGVQRSAVA